MKFILVNFAFLALWARTELSDRKNIHIEGMMKNVISKHERNATKSV